MSLSTSPLYRKRFRKNSGSENGIALFMVISALALLTYLLAELTYSTQVHSRMAHNFIDNNKAYYLLKAGYKISLLRLKAYKSVMDFLGQNQAVKKAIPQKLVDQIWQMPFMFPIPIPKDALKTEAEDIEKFQKESSLPGKYISLITGESAKLNVNLLFVKTATPTPGASPTPGAPPTPTPTAQAQDVDFTKVLTPAIEQLLDAKKKVDLEFAETYRNVQGQDIVAAIVAYLFPDSPPSNLPGFKPILKPKNAPLYSLSELHMIPGIDDTLYNLIAPSLTVYTNLGLNVNTASKETIHSLIYEMTDDDADALMKKRDDPDVGKLWDSADAFWTDVGSTTVGKGVAAVQDRFTAANLQVTTDEGTYRINVSAQAGLSVRSLEAYVTLTQTPKPQASGTPPTPQQQPNTVPSPSPSGNAASGLKLIYWRAI